MSLPVSLSEILSAGRFTVVTDKRVYRHQEFLEIRDNKLVTKAFVRIPLSEIRLAFFRKIGRVKKFGRYGRFIRVSILYKENTKSLLGRVITENKGWALVEVASIYFLTPKKGSPQHTSKVS